MRGRDEHARITLGSLVAAVGLLVSVAHAEGNWATRADMPTPRWGFATSVVDGKIYAIGGSRSYGLAMLRSVEEYDPATNAWTAKSEMSVAREGLSTSVVDGKIYAIGGGAVDSLGNGYTGAETFTTVEEYDPATDRWSRRSDMPRARWWHSANVVDGKIYVIGGSPSYPFRSIRAVDVYDPATDSWTYLGDTPAAKYTGFSSIVDGKIYAIGGYGGLRRVDVYDPVTDSWTRKADMPTTRVAFTTSALDGKIYAIGGHGSSSPWAAVSTVEMYDPDTDTWTTAPAVPAATTGCRSAVVDGKLYVIGGLSPTWVSPGSGATNEYDPDRSVEADLATTVAGQPTPLQVTVVLGRPLEETETWQRLLLDLSPLGITDQLPLEHVGGGRYRLDDVVVPLLPGQHDLPILLESMTGVRHPYISVPIAVWPTMALSVFDEGLTGGGELSSRSVERLDPDQTEVVFAGSAACAVQGKKSSAGWTVGFPFAAAGLGYRFLRFAFHPGETTYAEGDRFFVVVAPGRSVNLLTDGRLDMARHGWQVVEIPLGLFRTSEPYIGVNFSGSFGGEFYIDAMELVLWTDGTEDLVILEDALAPGWEASGRNLAHLAPSQTDVVHTGSAACAVDGRKSFVGWTAKFQPTETFYHFDYERLRFAVYPGDAVLSKGDQFAVSVAPGKVVSLLDQVDMARKQWQVVEIPLSAFALDEPPINSVNVSGNFAGTFYLDDLTLLAVRPAPRIATAVREEHNDAIPQAFTLKQNFPNPFNPETTIRFDLPTAEEVDLTVYNLAGQQVATLAQGLRQAARHTLRWGGRDDDGRELASGVYLFRLQVGMQVQTRKMLLVR
jgi:N-acetylneuraminic acid mutarotase